MLLNDVKESGGKPEKSAQALNAHITPPDRDTFAHVSASATARHFVPRTRPVWNISPSRRRQSSASHPVKRPQVDLWQIAIMHSQCVACTSRVWRWRLLVDTPKRRMRDCTFFIYRPHLYCFYDSARAESHSTSSMAPSSASHLSFLVAAVVRTTVRPAANLPRLATCFEIVGSIGRSNQ
jgi:hypothetical protein